MKPIRAAGRSPAVLTSWSGLARSGMAAALALRARGEEVIGTDLGTPAGTDTLTRAGVSVHVGPSRVWPCSAGRTR